MEYEMTDNNKISITLEAQYKDKGSLGKLNHDITSIGKIGSIRQMDKDLQGTNIRAQALTGTFQKLGYTLLSALAVRQIATYGAELIRIADQYTGINARLKLVTSSSTELANVQNELYRISQETGTLYTDNADSYAKLGMALKELGADSKETLSVTELVNKSLIINGSTTAMISSFMLQFAQAMGSGVLQGDEFRAMMESNSYFARELAKALGTDIGGLRQMSKEGKLTTDVLRGAFPKMADDINRTFKDIPTRVDMAMNQVRNAFGKVVNETNQASGGTSKVAAAVSEMARTIEQNGPTIREFFADTATLTAKSVDAIARFLNTLSAFRDLTRAKISINDYFELDPDKQRAYGSIRTELQMIKGLESDIANARRALVLHERFSIFYDDESLAAEKAEISEMESYVETLRVRIVEKTKKFGDGFKEVGREGKEAFSQVGESANSSADKQVKVTGAALEVMKNKYKEYADQVKKLQNDIAGREQSLAEQLREMQRSGMSDLGAWQDRRKEMNELSAAAKNAEEASKKAFAAGDVQTGISKGQEAIGFYDKAAEAAKDLNREVRDGDTVIATQKQNLQLATSELGRNQKAAIEMTKIMSDGITKAAQDQNKLSGGQLAKDLPEIAKQFGELKTQTDSLKESVDEFNKKWNDAWERAALGGKDAIELLEAELKELTKDRYIKIYVQEIESKSSGGAVGLRLARGGKLPGYGGGDRVRALLEPGEFVVRKEAVAKYGLSYLQAMNNMRLQNLSMIRANMGGMIKNTGGGYQRFQSGGQVLANAPSETINVNLSLPIQGKPVPMQMTRQNAKEFLRQLKAMHRARS